MQSATQTDEARHVKRGWVNTGSESVSNRSSTIDDIDSVNSFDNREVTNSVPEALDSQGTNGWIGSIFLIVNAGLGAGLLDFPQAYGKAGGILISMTMQAFLLTFIICSLIVLAYCAKKHACTTYQEVILWTCGRHMGRLSSALIALYTYGTCITFIIIIGDLNEQFLKYFCGNEHCQHWYLTREFVTVAVSVVFILPLCVPKKLDFLKYPSSLGVIAVFYIVALIVYEFYEGKFPTPATIKTVPDRWEDVITVVPVICFGYQCHVSAVPIYTCMQEKRVSTFTRSILVAIATCALVYSVAGIFGYLTFGQNVPSDILMAYSAKKPFVFVGLVALGLKIITTYPILMFCGRLALDDLWPKSEGGATGRRCSVNRLIVSLGWFCTTLLIASLVPTISIAISCIGSLAAVFIFIFPALALLQTIIMFDDQYQRVQTKVVIVYTIISVTIGTFIFAQVLSKSIWQIVMQ